MLTTGNVTLASWSRDATGIKVLRTDMASEYIIIARNEVLTQTYDYAPENDRKK